MLGKAIIVVRITRCDRPNAFPSSAHHATSSNTAVMLLENIMVAVHARAYGA
jgi:hypothetical protein